MRANRGWVTLTPLGERLLGNHIDQARPERVWRPGRFRESPPWYLPATMARDVRGPSEARASQEGVNEENDGDDDGGDWPPLFELDLKLSILMGRVASNAALTTLADVRPEEQQRLHFGESGVQEELDYSTLAAGRAGS